MPRRQRRDPDNSCREPSARHSSRFFSLSLYLSPLLCLSTSSTRSPLSASSASSSTSPPSSLFSSTRLVALRTIGMRRDSRCKIHSRSPDYAYCTVRHGIRSPKYAYVMPAAFPGSELSSAQTLRNAVCQFARETNYLGTFFSHELLTRKPIYPPRF